MIEVNDIGEQVATALQFDLEYENLIMASMRGRQDKLLVVVSLVVSTVGCTDNKGSQETRVF